jgi:NADH:ubiquinone oxidoreductase subunit 2 (subunit N)
MSAPFLWIFIPGAAAFILYFLRRWEKSIYYAGVLIALVLAWLAWQLPIGQPIAIRLWPGLPALRIAASMTLYSTRLTLNNSNLQAVVIIYLSIFYWSIGAYVARSGRLFVPLSLGGAALLVASLAIQPGIYAAPLVAMFALLSAPILSPPGHTGSRQNQVSDGVFRMITYQILGMCLVMFAEWSLLAATGAAQAQGSTEMPNRLPAIVALLLGFALLMSAFPFHTWMPILGSEANPYSAAFIFYFLPAAVAFMALATISRLQPLGISPILYSSLRYGGLGLVLVGGIWAAFEKRLGRILAFAAIAQGGMILLGISLHEKGGSVAQLTGIYFVQLMIQGLSLAVWAQGLCALEAEIPKPESSAPERSDLHFRTVQGLARRAPAAAAGVLLANFSLAGLPLLASFPIDLALWSALAQNYLTIAVLAFLSKALLFVAGLRTLAVLTQTTDTSARWRLPKMGLQTLHMIAGCILLLLAGLFPHLFFPILTNMAIIFSGGQ